MVRVSWNWLGLVGSPDGGWQSATVDGLGLRGLKLASLAIY